MNLKAYVEANPKLVKARPSTRYPSLRVVKYTRMVFYGALWTPELEECRGLVVDQDWNPVIRPFRKIYNRGEMGTDIPVDERVTAVRKINGFMAAATWVPAVNDVVVSTTGSLDSPFVTLAEKHLRPSITDWIERRGQGYTWLFEICDPSDPHIIPEEPGFYLIGQRPLAIMEPMCDEMSLDSYAQLMGGVMRPVYYPNIKFSTIISLTRDCHHEGFVVHTADKSLKIKSPYYLVNKFLARVKPERLQQVIESQSWRQTMDEEFFPLMAWLSTSLDIYMALDEQARLAFLRDWFNTQVVKPS